MSDFRRYADGSQYAQHQQDEIEHLRAALVEAEARLPEGMKHCTIEYKQCAVGHGRLTATNWIDHGCLWCALAKAKCEKSRQIVELQEQLHYLFGIEQSRDKVEADLSAARMTLQSIENHELRDHEDYETIQEIARAFLERTK